MKKLIMKICIAVAGAFVLIVGGICAYAGVTTNIGMRETHGEEEGSMMFKEYFRKGRNKLKEL